ncbi:hypothetical protein OY671_005730 [Metschnikowia pulcherrima]|nr:hypothetical protein OY671_005730 [Metschnikowia pulcherrima]
MTQELNQIKLLRQRVAEINKAKEAQPDAVQRKRYSLKKEFLEQAEKTLPGNNPFAIPSDNDTKFTTFGDIKNTVQNTWKRCSDAFADSSLRERLRKLVCNNISSSRERDLILSLEDPWVNVGDARFHHPKLDANKRHSMISFASTTRLGIRNKISEKLSKGKLSLSTTYSKLRGRDSDNPRDYASNKYSQVVFDADFDRKWQLGFCPDVYISSKPNSAGLDKSRRRAGRNQQRTYKRLAPYDTLTMYSSMKSAPLDVEEYAELHRQSTPVDVNKLLTEFEGLEAVYITDEAHFFINNLADNTNEDNRKLVNLVSSLMAQTATTRASRDAQSVVSRMASVLRSKPKSLKPPSVGSSQASLRPLLLVKDSRLCLRIPETPDTRKTEREPTIFELTEEESLKSTASPSVQSKLRDLKLVQRRSQRRNSFVVPVWKNFSNERNKSEADGASEGKRRLAAVVKKIQARPLADKMDSDTEVFI